MSQNEYKSTPWAVDWTTTGPWRCPWSFRKSSRDRTPKGLFFATMGVARGLRALGIWIEQRQRS